MSRYHSPSAKEALNGTGVFLCATDECTMVTTEEVRLKRGKNLVGMHFSRPPKPCASCGKDGYEKRDGVINTEDKFGAKFWACESCYKLDEVVFAKGTTLHIAVNPDTYP